MMRVTFKDPNFDDSEISELLHPLSNLENNIKSKIKERSNRLHHKLSAIKFHKNNFIKEEDKEITKYKDYYQAENTEYIFDNNILIYETESFLFQIKSSLDILGQIIGIICKFNDCTTYTDDGDIIIKRFENNCPKELKEIAPRFIELLKNNKQWLSEVISMRDQITHWSDLEGFLCFIHTAWEPGNDEAIIYYPSMPNGKRVRKYMEETWQRLYDFYNQILPLLIEAYTIRKIFE
jgi:hypothetical protein